jgi:hypothetical protein
MLAPDDAPEYEIAVLAAPTFEFGSTDPISSNKLQHGFDIAATRSMLIEPAVPPAAGAAQANPTQERAMTKLMTLFLVMAFSSVALAFHCPADMKKIDAAIEAKPTLSADKLSEVKKLRADGEALHKAGKHQESVDTLAKAMKILGI